MEIVPSLASEKQEHTLGENMPGLGKALCSRIAASHSRGNKPAKQISSAMSSWINGHGS